MEGRSGIGKTALVEAFCATIDPQTPVHSYSAWPTSSWSAFAAQFANSAHLDRESDLLRLCQRLELQRAVLVIDHIQGLEGAGDLLAWASRHLRYALVVGVTSEKLQTWAGARIQRLQLSGLAQPEALQLLRQHCQEFGESPDPQLLENLAECQGVPWKILQLAATKRLHDESAPSPSGQHLLELLSLRPRGLPKSALASHPVAELDQNFLLEEYLLRQHIWVRPHSPKLVTDPARCQSLHQQARTLLATWHGTGLEWIEERVVHGLLAQEYSSAIQELLEWSGHFLRQGRFSELIELIDRSLTRALERQTPELYHIRAECEVGLGYLHKSLADFGRAIDLGNTLDSALVLRALNSRSHLFIDMGKLSEAESDARAALAIASASPTPLKGAVKAHNGLSRISTLLGRLSEAQNHSLHALQLAGQLGDKKGQAYSTFILGQALQENDQWDQALSHFYEAIDIAHQIDEVRLGLLARYWCGIALLHLERDGQGHEMLEQAWRDSRGFPDLKMKALGELVRSQSLQRQGLIQQAWLHLQEAEAYIARCGFPLLSIRSLLLAQSQTQDPSFGERARALAAAVGLKRGDNKDHSHRVWLLGIERLVSAETLDQIRQQRPQYDLFIDFQVGQVFEKSRGDSPVSLLRKKVLVSLLLPLLQQPGTAFSTEQLYASGWGHDYEGESSAAQVRKNIAALRSLIEPDRHQPSFILVREHQFGQSGGYYFNPQIRSCVIF